MTSRDAVAALILFGAGAFGTVCAVGLGLLLYREAHAMFWRWRFKTLINRRHPEVDQPLIHLIVLAVEEDSLGKTERDSAGNQQGAGRNQGTGIIH